MTIIGNLQDKLEELRPSAEALNKASDLLNERILQVEDYVAKLGCGVFAEVEVSRCGPPPEHPEQPTESTYLCYGRPDGKWGLFSHRRAFDHSGLVNESYPVRLTESPRDVRIAAAHKIEDLVDQIKVAAEKKREELRDATRRIPPV